MTWDVSSHFETRCDSDAVRRSIENMSTVSCKIASIVVWMWWSSMQIILLRCTELGLWRWSQEPRLAP